MARNRKRPPIKESTYNDLHRLKRPGDTFDDVVSRLIEDYQSEDENGLIA